MGEDEQAKAIPSETYHSRWIRDEAASACNFSSNNFLALEEKQNMGDQLKVRNGKGWYGTELLSARVICRGSWQRITNLRKADHVSRTKAEETLGSTIS